jgi:hypothetical protein
MNHLFHLLTAALLFVQFNIAPAAYSANEKNAALPATEDEEVVPWSGSRRLTWQDFKCEPVRNTEAVALTSTSLGISYKVKNNQFIYDISCGFSKRHSWGLLRTSYILAHEQGHFDITEIYARKLHHELQHYRFNPASFKEDINTIYQNIVKGKEDLQNLYDSETDHSRKKVRQEEWLVRIEALLADTAPYQKYP